MMVDVIEILSALVHLGAFAGQVIREVVDSGESLRTISKADTAFDPQTIADTRAQQRIVESLRRHFGSTLTIVGEEGQLDVPADEDVLAPLPPSALLMAAFAPLAVAIEDVAVWIDPLDGTRKFTEKVYDDVSVLLGISVRGRPIAGVMHQPFLGPFGTTYFGGPAIDGVVVCVLPSAEASSWQFTPVARPSTMPRPRLLVGISETPCDLVDAVLPSLNMDILVKGSTGILLLDVLLGRCDVYLRLVHRTKRWDTCVGEAFVTVFGGRVTDRHGHLYVYDPAADYENLQGVVASLDSATGHAVVALVNDPAKAR
ncbi:Aste57867_2191 [Aphanomyces stellatus]|uniref:Aste57867_2191 protein n=1 Tax=Aphanomyces stellatus TaxID=120398 RepID=A0A485K9J7_9STRA|nr:hypothetical protein As57867_002186 [Aphanomyces stellatus]VFT79394.1 Aste57867_2191 [Aphanomyces stellatus]